MEQILSEYISRHMNEKDVMGNCQCDLAKRLNHPEGQRAGERSTKWRGSGEATGIAGLERLACKERLWGQGLFGGSRDGFTAPNCSLVHTELDHRGGVGLFTVVPGGRVTEAGCSRRCPGWVSENVFFPTRTTREQVWDTGRWCCLPPWRIFRLHGIKP